MNVFPVIVRELRAQARQPFSYSLRILGVLALLGGGAAFALRAPFAANLGGTLFAYLHRTLFFAIWILVPLSTADCISRERREGTLGLLFLTPLKPADIVIAKSLAHGLRALTILVAVLPVLTIPFLLGGLSWQQAAVSAVVNVTSVCWSLAAAIVASAVCRKGLRAMVISMMFALCAFIALVYVTGYSVVRPMSSTPGWFSTRVDYTWLLGFGVTGISSRSWSTFTPSFSPGFIPAFSPNLLLWGVVQSLLVALLVLAAAVLLAASQIRHSWREEPPPVWMQWWQKKFCTPVVATVLYRQWMRWKLRRNPIGWLEQRTWQGRLVTWSWFAVITSIYSAYFTDKMFFKNFSGFQETMAWLMMGSIALSAAGSFRRERETRVLELLLVAPLTTGQIIGGRLRGLWGQFLPALAMLLGIWLYFDAIFKSHSAAGPVLFFSVTFLTLPVIGLYFSVRCRHFLSAFLLTLVVGLAAPLLIIPMFQLAMFLYAGPALIKSTGSEGVPCLAQIVLAFYFLAHLRQRLESRSFPLERAQS